MKTRMPKRVYTVEFREAAVRQMMEAGRSAREVACSLDISPKTLGNWVRRARRGKPLARRAAAVPVNDAQAELSRLRAENARLKLDNEILKNRLRGRPRPICIETGGYTDVTQDSGRLLFGGVYPRQKTWPRGSRGPSCGGTQRDPV